MVHLVTIAANPTLATFHLLHGLEYTFLWRKVARGVFDMPWYICYNFLMEAPKLTGKSPETRNRLFHMMVFILIYFKFCYFHIWKNRCFMGQFFLGRTVYKAKPDASSCTYYIMKREFTAFYLQDSNSVLKLNIGTIPVVWT